MDITGRKLFVKALQEEGVDTIFGYPGGMVTDLFDELDKQDAIEAGMNEHVAKPLDIKLLLRVISRYKDKISRFR